MPTSQNNIAFIGLGVMGYPMALNLRRKLDNTKTIYICDVNQSALDRFREETKGYGPVEVVKDGHEAALRADIVVTMLPSSSAVRDVYLDRASGVIAGVAAAVKQSPGRKLLMECGTIESATILEVAKATAELSQELQNGSEVDFVDAPVSGGPMGAQAGSLAFMVGTDRPEAVFPRVKNVLVHMGNPDSIFLCGGVSSGVGFKIINNYLSAITSLAASEALNIGVKLGYDPKKLTDVINASGGQCWITSKSNPVPGVQENVPSSRGYEGGFRIELCHHVLEMGAALAKQAGARTVLDQPTLRAFEEAKADERYKGKDARVVYRWLNESTP